MTSNTMHGSSAPSSSALADRDIVRQALTEIGGLSGLLRLLGLLASSDPAERALLYDAVGISGTYEPQVDRLILTTHPVGHMVRVGGGVVSQDIEDTCRAS